MEELREEVDVKEFQEEAGGEMVKVGWTCGPKGMEKTDMGGLCEDIFGND